MDRRPKTNPIRRATISDAEAVAKCVADAYRHYVPRMGKAPGPMLEDYREVIQHHEVYVIDSNKELAEGIDGVLVMVKQPERFLLDNIAVHPRAQGSGLGRALMDLAEISAREAGYGSVQLYTHECMTENIAMYKKLGFRETNRITEKGYQRIYFEKFV